MLVCVYMYDMYVCAAIIYIYENRTNLVYDSEFHASSQSSGIKFYFYLYVIKR